MVTAGLPLVSKVSVLYFLQFLCHSAAWASPGSPVALAFLQSPPPCLSLGHHLAVPATARPNADPPDEAPLPPSQLKAPPKRVSSSPNKTTPTTRRKKASPVANTVDDKPPGKAAPRSISGSGRRKGKREGPEEEEEVGRPDARVGVVPEKVPEGVEAGQEDMLWTRMMAGMERQPTGSLEEYEEALGDLRRLGEWEAAWAKLEEAVLQGVDPSPAMYREVLLVCEKEAKPKGVLRLFDLMRHHGAPIDEQAFEAALKACDDLHNATRAVEIFSLLPQPTVRHYGLAASACFRGGDREKALRLVEDARIQGLSPLESACGPVMMACSESDEDWALGLVLLEELQCLPGATRDPALLMEAYTAAVACASRGFQHHEALRLLEEYKEARQLMVEVRALVREHGHFYRPSVTLDDLEGLGQGSSTSFALLQCMVEDGLTPDSLSYGLALEACGLEARYDRILLLHEMMKTSDPPVQLGRMAPWKRLEPWEQMGSGQKEVLSRVFEALEACGPAVQGLADQLYEEAYGNGDFEHWSEVETHMVDLHHLTTPLARAALRHVYEDALGRPSRASFHLEALSSELMIITGQGRGSQAQESRLRPATLRYLNQAMEPGQQAAAVAGNAGRVSVPKARMDQWVEARRQEEGRAKQEGALADAMARCRAWRARIVPQRPPPKANRRRKTSRPPSVS